MTSRRRTVVWSTSARDDLLDVAVWIGRDDPVAALAVLDRLERAANTLDTLPERGRPVAEVAHLGPWQELVVRPWRLVYRIAADEVHVLGVFDSRRDLKDTLFQRLVDIWMSFPALVLLITIVSTFSRGGDFWNRVLAIIVVMGVIMAAGSSRVIRGAAISVKNNQYVEAARCIGASDARILAQHVLPNVFAVIIILATVQLGAAILAESSISFLGWGVPPPFPSWGQMLSYKGILFMRAHPWIALWPGLAIALAVYGFNMLGDALRDVLDPRLRGGR